MSSHEPSPAPEDVPPEGVFCTLRLIRKKDGSEISRYPVDGEVTSFGRDESNDVRLYYNDISRFHCTLHSSPDEANATLKVTGTNGVEVNGKLVKPPAEVILKAGDMFEMRKKRFVITFPHAPSQGSALASPARQATPRRKRPSQRMSLMPNDLPQSPYAASPLRKPIARSSVSTPSRTDERAELGTPVRGKPETAGATPFKTPRSVPLPAASETPYVAPPSPAAAPPPVVVGLAPPLRSARKVGPHGPSSLRKAILMRSAKQAAEGGGASEVEPESVNQAVEEADLNVEADLLEMEASTFEAQDDDSPLDASATAAAEAEQEEQESPEPNAPVGDDDEGDDNNSNVEPEEMPSSGGPTDPVSDEFDPEDGEDAQSLHSDEGDGIVDAEDEWLADTDDVDEAGKRSLVADEEAEMSFEEESASAGEVSEPLLAADEAAGELSKARVEATPEDEGTSSPSPSPVLPGTPQMIRPVSDRYYTPQPGPSSSNAPRSSALLRTMGPPVRIAAPRPSASALSRMGPPVRVPVSERKPGVGPVGAVGRFVKAEGGSQRRSSMGSPIRVPKVPGPERREAPLSQDRQASPRQSTPSVAERAGRRDSTASILASAPRALPRLSTLDLAGLSSPRKTPAAPPLALADPAGSSSDDEASTPLRALAKKAERLKRKSLGGRASVGGEESPRRRISSLYPSPYAGVGGGTSATTPVRSRLAQVTTGTPSSSSTQGTPLGSTSAPAQHEAGEQQPPTPDMGPIRHLFKAPTSTPQYAGVRQLLRTPNQPPPEADPSFTGVGALFASPREAESAGPMPPSPSVRPAAGRNTEEPRQELTMPDAVASAGSPSPAVSTPRPGRRVGSMPSTSTAPFPPAVVDDEDELVMEVDPSPAHSPTREPSSSPAPQQPTKPATTATRTRAAAPPKKTATAAESRKRKTPTPPPAAAENDSVADVTVGDDNEELHPPPKAAPRSRAAATAKPKAPPAPKPRATRKAAANAATSPPAESSSPASADTAEADEDEDVIAVESPEPKRPTGRSRVAATSSSTTTAKKPTASKKAAAPVAAAAKKSVGSRTRKATTPIDDDDEDMGEKNSIPVPKTTRSRATTAKVPAVPAAIAPKPRAPRKVATPAVKDEAPEEALPPVRSTRASRSRK